MRRILLAAAYLWTALPASAVERQFPRPPIGHADNAEFTVTVQQKVAGACLSYWGSNGKNWATTGTSISST